jgi:hypothetical protein
VPGRERHTDIKASLADILRYEVKPLWLLSARPARTKSKHENKEFDSSEADGNITADSTATEGGSIAKDGSIAADSTTTEEGNIAKDGNTPA